MCLAQTPRANLQSRTTQEQLEVSLWRRGPNGEPVIEYSAHVYATFLDKLELKNFPCDVMRLRIKVASQLPSHVLCFKEDKFNGVRSEKPNHCVEVRICRLRRF